MAQLRAALAAFHLPTLLFALAVAIGSAVSVNGQPLDMASSAGRSAAAMAIVGVLVAAVRTWQANGGPQLPAATRADLAATAAGLTALIEAQSGSSAPAVDYSATTAGAVPNPEPASPPAVALAAAMAPVSTNLPTLAVSPVSVAPSASGAILPEPASVATAPAAPVSVDAWLANNNLPSSDPRV